MPSASEALPGRADILNPADTPPAHATPHPAGTGAKAPQQEKILLLPGHFATHFSPQRHQEGAEGTEKRLMLPELAIVKRRTPEVFSTNDRVMPSTREALPGRRRPPEPGRSSPLQIPHPSSGRNQYKSTTTGKDPVATRSLRNAFFTQRRKEAQRERRRCSTTMTG